MRIQHLVAMVLAMSSMTAYGQETRPSPADELAHAQLMADVATIKPGQTFRVGVLFNISPGWHIYWRNPGDAGLPTRVKFTVPDDFSVSEAIYPVPRRIVQPGDIVIYGYENKAMFLATVTAPRTLVLDSMATITANVSFLVCDDVCLPGKTAVSLTLPVAAESTPVNQGLFPQWVSQAPVPSAQAPGVESLQENFTSTGGLWQASVKWKSPPKSVELIPGSIEGYNVDHISVKTDGLETKISFNVETVKGLKSAGGMLQSVIAYEDDGGRHGIAVSLPLESTGG